MERAEPTRIVASAHVRDAAELLDRARAARPFADLFEARLDEWRGSAEELAAAIERCELPVVATARPRFEGGAFARGEQERRALLLAASTRASFVDVESRAAFARDSFAPARKVVSLHDFDSTPSDAELRRRVAELRAVARDAALVKLATTARSLDDVGRVARLQLESREPLVAIAMGELGLPTRLLAGRLGAPWVYGSVPGAEPTAAGQPDVRDLAELVRVREQSASTRVCAVVGDPIAHSLSPRLHNTLYRESALDRVFVAIRASRMDDALALADLIAIDGLSVTLPLKEAAARVAVGAAANFPWPPPEGAVNTLLRSPRGWVAANTDRVGFEQALDRAAPDVFTAGRRVLVLGAGGVARTAVAACTARRMRVSIASRTLDRAKSLARQFGAEATPLSAARDATEVAPFDLIVNATPVGMQRHDGVPLESPLPEATLRRGQVVFDLVYRPRHTPLLEQARRAGARPIEGLEMFVAQALAQFELFTRHPADPTVARRIVEQALS
jgi:3-dehydroquinate dehydratase/shikimate dehydrogenase